jgi:hypothetical protein
VLCAAACSAPAQNVPSASTLMDEPFGHAWTAAPRNTAWLEANRYHLFAHTPGAFVAVRAPLAAVPSDLVVNGTFHKVGGPAGGGYGLILQDQATGAGDGVDQSGQYIVAAVSDRGEVGVWRRDGAQWLDLLPWTRSPAVRTNTASNDLIVNVRGGRLRFQVNDTEVADLEVGPRPGGVGIFAGGDLNEVLVDSFRVQAPGASQAGRARPTAVALTPRPAAQPPKGEQNPGPPDLSGAQRVRELLAAIFEDIASIADSFSGGLDNPRNPVSDPNTLKRDSARLDAATRKANELAQVLDTIRNGGHEGGR